MRRNPPRPATTRPATHDEVKRHARSEPRRTRPVEAKRVQH